jgi:phosphopantetheine--protein transferase-like protein
MSELVKTTVSQFLQVPVDSVTDSTIIDRSGLGSSVMVHRMYGKLAEAGFHVENYHDIISYSDLIKRLNGETIRNGASIPFIPMPTSESSIGIGIDIETAEAMPPSNDFREDPFYIQNFTQAEISHCILSPNPYMSFAGLFAAKEAIYKTGVVPVNVPFSKIEISYTSKGKPVFGNIALSISHTDTTAVAVAYNYNNVTQTQDSDRNNAAPQESIIFKSIAVIALLLSIVSLVLQILK